MKLSTKIRKLLLLLATSAVTLGITGGGPAAATSNILPPGNYQAASR